MKTVNRMIEELKKFPMDAKCYGYEGEKIGLGVITDGLCGFIDTSTDDAPTEFSDVSTVCGCDKTTEGNYGK